MVVLCDATAAAVLPFNPQALGAVPRSGLQHCRPFTTNTNGSRTRRNDHELFHADGWPGVSQLLGGGRHGGRHCLHPYRPEGERHHWQLLGGHGAATLWILLPLSIVGALFLSQGVVPETMRPAAVIDPQTVTIPAADGKRQTTVLREQTIARTGRLTGDRKQFGTSGAASSTRTVPTRSKPTPLSNFLAMFGIFLISSGLTYTLGSMTGSRRHGWAVWGAMAFLFLAGVSVAYWAEARGNPMLTALGADQTDGAVVRQQHGRERGPVWHCQHGALCHRDHRRELRDQQLA